MSSQLLKSYIPLITAIGKTIGIGEIVLYDFTEEPPSILAREGGITSREPGTQASQFLLEMVKEMKDAEETIRLNYETATKSGKPLKSTTMLIINSKGNVEGVLSLNMDMSAVSVIEHFINQLTGREKVDSQDEMPQNTQEFLSIMIQKSIDQISKPACYFDKKDNLEVVRFLNDHHVFTIKGATDTLAKELNVSRYTIYNYIEEVRSS